MAKSVLLAMALAIGSGVSLQLLLRDGLRANRARSLRFRCVVIVGYALFGFLCLILIWPAD